MPRVEMLQKFFEELKVFMTMTDLEALDHAITKHDTSSLYIGGHFHDRVMAGERPMRHGG